MTENKTLQAIIDRMLNYLKISLRRGCLMCGSVNMAQNKNICE